MSQITKAGSKLAWQLAKSLGYTREIAETCSLIHRHAVSHCHIQEGYCNGHPAQGYSWMDVKEVNKLQVRYGAWLDKRDAQLEQRITELVESLPHTDSGPIGVEFMGDPRGSTVKLLMPDGNTYGWEHGKVCVLD